MNHPVFLCFHSLKYYEDNCAQKDSRFWKKGRSPVPGPAQSKLSCGLRLSCSGVLPAKVKCSQWCRQFNHPGQLSHLWAVLRGKGFLLSPAWPLHVSACAADSHLPAKQHWSLLQPLLPMLGMLFASEAVPSPSWTSLGSTDSPCRTRTPVVMPWWHPLTSHQFCLDWESSMAVVMKAARG